MAYHKATTNTAFEDVSHRGTAKTGMILLNTDQAAEFFGLQPCTLNDWRWQRKGPPLISISRGCVRYDQATLEKWVASKTIYKIPRVS